ncbi:C40 family peptidase [Gryllotalpicola ginsengisoli]|uniref:C40 family peptidase n=1 Tax=Gryllotalpicola ginsengisoli TaxID=444608 RepID=UPI0003B4BBEE|nr:C40 family peptidase [Gryllotalpicola ginsengisoli]
MAEQRIGASLDAFDALIADLAAAGEVHSSEVTALRRQRRAPRTAEIPVVNETAVVNRWAVAPEQQDLKPQTPAHQAHAHQAQSHQPMTRREARALREGRARREAHVPPLAPGHKVTRPAPVDEVVAEENVRRTEDLIRSHRVLPDLDQAPTPVAVLARPKPARRSIRRTVLSALGAFALAPSLLLVVPANANAINPSATTVDAHGHTAQQLLSVADSVKTPSVDDVNYVANAIATIVAEQGGADVNEAAPAIADAMTMGGERQKIVDTALSYIGTWYVFGGASHTGIDCSGLTMRAYESVGIEMAHAVTVQDTLGTRITEAEAKPGDLVVFDNLEHVGIYLGGGQVLHAPAPGRKVSIESVDIWKPVGIHFLRILPAGK